MENKINIAELLKYCEKGMELDCILFKDTPAYLHAVITDTNYPIEIKVEYPSKELETFFLNKYGAIYDRPTSNCVIFPKNKTTWEGFVPPCEFKTGDVLFVDCSDSDDEDKSYQYIFILNDPEFYGKWHSYCHLDGVGCFHSEETYLTDDEYYPRLATEEEKQKLFHAIKNNGYNWNAETKTLEKLPKFKVGDKVVKKGGVSGPVSITGIGDEYYYSSTESSVGVLPIKDQDEWELVPDKFDIANLKPFDKVLVRHNDDNKWCASFFSHIDKDLHSHCFKFVTIAGKSYPKMIPYECNEHLLGTTNDCSDYYKNW